MIVYMIEELLLLVQDIQFKLRNSIDYSKIDFAK